MILPNENKDEFYNLQEQLLHELSPKGSIECRLVEQIAMSFWRLRRVYSVEAGLFVLERSRIEMDRIRDELGSSLKQYMPTTLEYEIKEKDNPKFRKRFKQARNMEKSEVSTIGLAFVRDAEKTNAFSKLSRYESTIERSMYRALHELQGIQAARKEGSTSEPVALDVIIDDAIPSSPRERL